MKEYRICLPKTGLPWTENMEYRGLLLVIFSVLFYILYSIFPIAAHAAGSASLSLSPGQGTFVVGNTFDVSIFVNTNGNDINTVEANLKFSADTLQIVSPSAGQSFISVWVTQPTFSNEEGMIHFAGGLPSPGINTTAGLVSTITFRAKAPGAGVIEILPSSKVLLNDGKGTNILTSTAKGSYQLTLAAPGGPEISSSTHSDQNAWYKNNNPVFSWSRAIASEQGGEMAEFSWWFDEDPRGYTDNKADGTAATASFNDVKSGIWYFHVKGRVGEAWGQQSSYAVHIDNTPPAAFTPTVQPEGSRLNEKRIVTFATTDQHSGLDHYEVKIFPLDEDVKAEPFFTEHTSPWLTPSLGVGRYQIIVRAFDKAGNWQDGTLVIANEPPPPSLQERLSQGIIIGGQFIPWWMLGAIGVILLLIILVILILWRRAHEDVAEQIQETLEKAHRRLQHEHEKITAELKEEQEVKEVLSHELEHLKKDNQDKIPH